MTLPQTYASTEALERALGRPEDAASPLSYLAAVAYDEREELPQATLDALHQLDFQRFYVPDSLPGGGLHNCEELLSLIRSISRRDLTAAIAHGKTFLGASPVWIGGTDEQKRRLAALILESAPVACAFTEREHGADLLACEVSAERSPTGYRLSGEKWIINNATRSKAVSVFTRTDPRGGARGFSFFLVEKDALTPSSYQHLPKVKTLGIRGADISGVSFSGAEVPETSLVGGLGMGLEIGVKALQLTRTMCAGFSLGAADSALRLALEFALSRRIYQGTVFQLEQPKRALSEALLDLWIAESTSLAGARGISVNPEQASVSSAVVKYLAPVLSEEIVKSTSIVLGARHYLRESFHGGVFQKLLRDNSVVSFFDGNTTVNLSALVLSLGQLLRLRPSAERAEKLGRLFSLSSPLPALALDKLELSSRGRDDVTQSIEEARAGLAARSHEAPAAYAGTLLARLHEEITQQHAQWSEFSKQHGMSALRAPAAFQLAHRYTLYFAALSCAQLWLHSRDVLRPSLASGEAFALCLYRVIGQRLGLPVAPPPEAWYGAVSGELVGAFERRELFSVLPIAGAV